MEKYQLPKEFAEKWIEALRSGEYKQGRDKLATINDANEICYCCLGVACKLQNIKDTELEQYGEIAELTKIDADEDFNNEYTDLLDIGIPYNLIGTQLPNELITLNDNEKKSFVEIADWIIENVELI